MWRLPHIKVHAISQTFLTRIFFILKNNNYFREKKHYKITKFKKSYQTNLKISSNITK